MTASLPLPRLDAWLGRLEARLAPLPRTTFAIVTLLATLGVSLLCYSPKFVYWARGIPTTAAWARAHAVLVQAQAPLDLQRAETEAALRWRILPALVIHAAGGGVAAVVLLPWLGLVTLLYAVVRWLDRTMADRTAVLLGCLLLGTSGAFITITNFLGMNDAWFLLALGAVTFSPRLPVLLAGIAGPWVDERFILALPLALLARQLIHAGEARKPVLAAALAGPVLYLLLRLAALLTARDNSSVGHLNLHLAQLAIYLPYAPFGWLMGFRFGWVLLGLAIFTLWRTTPRLAGYVIAATGLGMAAVTLVAADLTRSTNLLVPLLLALLPWLHRQWGAARLRRTSGLVLAGNLLTPFVWVTYVHCITVWPLPAEIWRCLR